MTLERVKIKSVSVDTHCQYYMKVIGNPSITVENSKRSFQQKIKFCRNETKHILVFVCKAEFTFRASLMNLLWLNG